MVEVKPRDRADAVELGTAIKNSTIRLYGCSMGPLTKAGSSDMQMLHSC